MAQRDEDMSAVDLEHEFSSWKLRDMCGMEETVENVYRGAEVDASRGDIECIAKYLTSTSVVDVAGIFSPERFTSSATGMGLRPGFVIDLSTIKKNGEHWDMSREEDRDELQELQEGEGPYLLIGGLPCEAFSALQRLNQMRVDPEMRRPRLEQGRQHLNTAVSAYRRQIQQGSRYFLHEHPFSADSWKEQSIDDLQKEKDVYFVKGPMCRWSMRAEGARGEGFVRKDTGWLTNSPALRDILEGGCSNKGKPVKDWHRHVHLINGRARAAQVYPPRLVRAILRGLKEQMRSDGALGEIGAVSAGPTGEEEIFADGKFLELVDDVNGCVLQTDLVNEARRLELE